MIKDLVQYGCSAADRLILRDALNSHYESLIARDGSDVTADVSVLPKALVWIYDLEQTVVVVAVQRQGMDTKYIAEVSIRPYTLDAAGRRIMCDPLPEEHDRCKTAAYEAALALAVHVAQRRLGATSDRRTTPMASRNRAISVYSSLFATGSGKARGNDTAGTFGPAGITCEHLSRGRTAMRS